jgi:hypothetical protein
MDAQSSAKVRQFALTIGATAMITFASAGAVRLLSSRIGNDRGTPTAYPLVRDRAMPVRILPVVSIKGELDEKAVGQALRQLRDYQPTTLSGLLHVLRLHGMETSLEAPGIARGIGALEGILEHDYSLALFGTPALVETRDGVRCQLAERAALHPETASESHEDQLLGVLAELGISLEHPLTTARARRTVRDLLHDALAKFDLGQREIEWSALAFALYLPPQRSWTDRFGKVVSFDDLVARLISLPPERRACVGTHLFYTLAMLIRADEQIPVLNARTRSDARSHLRRTVLALVRHQADDGSWGRNWLNGSEPVGTVAERILVTGHTAEWLMMLPAELQPPRDRLSRATRWLLHQLLACRKEAVARDYCPYSHSGRVLLILTRGSPWTTDPQHPREIHWKPVSRSI